MGEIGSDTRIRVAGGGRLPGQVRLPELPGIRPYEDPVVDRIGEVLDEHRKLLALGTVAGAALGARSGSGLLSRVLRGVGGAVAGLTGAFTLGLLHERVLGGGSTSTRAFVDRRPQPLLEPAASGSEDLRVMTWNVRGLAGDGTQRGDDAIVDGIRSVVEREHPDVLMLQEMQIDSVWRGDEDDLTRLATALGATDAVLVPNGTSIDGTQKGQAILTFGDTRIQDARGLHHLDPAGDGLLHQFQVAVTQGHDIGLPLPDLGVRFHARTTADMLLTTPLGRAVRFVDAHLSGTSSGGAGGSPGSTQRIDEQLKPLAATLDAWHGPTIMAGDFNTSAATAYGSYEASILGAHGLRDALTQAGTAPRDHARNSYQWSRPWKNIDRVYTSEEIHVRAAHVLQELEPAAPLSDHLPVVADVTID